MKQKFSSPRCKAVALITVISLSYLGCKKEDAFSPEKSAEVHKSGHFSNNEHVISEEEATELIHRFRAAYPSLNTRVYWTKLAIRNILAQPKVDGTRYYFGQTPNNRPELFMLAVDKNNDDMIEGDITQSKSAVLLSSRYEQTIPNNINWQDNQLISVDEAAASTARHRQKYTNVSLGGTFNKEAIELLLIKNAVFGVLSEHGLMEDGTWVIILRSLNNNGSVIPGLIINKSSPCPPRCGKPNKLNS